MITLGKNMCLSFCPSVAARTYLEVYVLFLPKIEMPPCSMLVPNDPILEGTYCN
jgi:hypothetical protein